MDIDIYKVMDDLAKDGYVFSNEQDFQFQMSLKLKELSNVEDVKLEALSLEKPFNNYLGCGGKEKLSKNAKEYTDIIVKCKDGEYIAIELKFKTPNKVCSYEKGKSGKVVTMAQGAYNFNAYYYLYDINRLENINNRYFCDDNITISKGYAILLTNYSVYRNNDFSKSKIWRNYSLQDGKTFNKGKVKFTTKNGEYKKPFKPIELKDTYNLKWRNYKLKDYQDYDDKEKSDHPGFSYLVNEIKLVK